MAQDSSISWTKHTWNPWIGCAKVSPACDGCYAENLMDTRYHRASWGGPGKGTGTRVRTCASTWNDPFRWNRQAEKDGDRPFVFCASLADIFDNKVDPSWRTEAFEVMRKTPRLVYLLLTKRPTQIFGLSYQAGGLPSNAAIGTTCEDQPRADYNLAALGVAKRLLEPLFAFSSFEPLLGPIWIDPADMPDWVITGGETDQGSHRARPTNPEWFRSLRDQCADRGVPFHHKQNGEWVSVSEVEGPGEHFEFPDGRTVRRVGKARSGRTIDGIEHNASPEIGDAA